VPDDNVILGWYFLRGSRAEHDVYNGHWPVNCGLGRSTSIPKQTTDYSKVYFSKTANIIPPKPQEIVQEAIKL